jgi:Hypoxia induced protein conserved region
VVLEIDDHCGAFLFAAGVLAHVAALVIPDCRAAASPESIITGQRIWIPGSRTAPAPRNDRTLNPGYNYAMSDFMSHVAVPIAIGAVAVVLLLGLYNMMRGGSANTSQKLMRLRVLLQFIAIIVIMLTVWIMSK